MPSPGVDDNIVELEAPLPTKRTRRTTARPRPALNVNSSTNNAATNGASTTGALSPAPAADDIDPYAVSDGFVVRQGPGINEFEIELSGKTRLITTILKPIILTMILVIILVKALNVQTSGGTVGAVGAPIMAYQEQSSDSDTTKLVGSIINAAVIIGVITIVTFVFVLLFKYRCFKVIYGWLICSVVMLLGFLGGLILYKFFDIYNAPLDWITLSLFVWNFMIGGVISVFWHAPAFVTHGYLVIISAILAYVFTLLPDWTTWTLLFALVVYDLVAVLCPKGPLNLLIQEAVKQQAPIPGLLYDASVPAERAPVRRPRRPSLEDEGDVIEAPPTVGGAVITHSPVITADPESRRFDSAHLLSEGNGAALPSRVSRGDAPGLLACFIFSVFAGEQSSKRQSNYSDEEVRTFNGGVPDPVSPPEDIAVPVQPVAPSEPTRPKLPEMRRLDEDGQDNESLKLGLGDFVFYSVLIGRAALYDVTTVVTCFLAVVAGLCMTLVCLAIWQKALPALPFSLTLGAIFFFLTRIVVVPYAQNAALAGGAGAPVFL